MEALTAIIATLGTLASVGVWLLCRWLDRRMERDDRKDLGDWE